MSLRSWRTCDNDPNCQTYLATVSTMHVFSDVSNYLPLDVKAEIVRLRPGKKANDFQKTIAHLEQRRYLFDNLKHGQGRETAHCCRHNRECPISYMDPQDKPTEQRPLKVNFSGPPCLPWTSLGSLAGYAHETIEAYNTWLATVVVSAPDIIFLENSDRFTFEDFETALGSGYTCVSLVFSLSDLGLPMNRPRTYAAGLNRETLVWAGATNPDMMLEEFLQIFGRRCALEADDFVGADTEVPSS